MATLALAAVGSAIGTAIGGTAFAGTAFALTSTVIGQAIGSALGAVIDSRLLAGGQTQTGPRLSQIQLMNSAEGVAINRHWGRYRLGGNVIWAAHFTRIAGSAGGKGTPSASTPDTYRISFAVGFCEGNNRATLGRMWFDGKLVDQSQITLAFYQGSETQTPDATIEGVEGAGNVAAFRGLAYVVFTDLDLTSFGNRVPQVTAEIIKPPASAGADSAETLIEAINIIPSTGETAYGTTPSMVDDGFGNSTSGNNHVSTDKTDLVHAMENLAADIPNTAMAQIVIAQFGSDLRANNCEFRPKVEVKTGRVITPTEWSVSGLNRAGTGIEAVSQSGGGPAFGGTPADWSVVEAIQYTADTAEMDVSFYPFVLMDIESGNTLPDTIDGSPGQPVYPWRGRITTSLPAVDKTAGAQTEIDALFGSVVRTDFTVVGTVVTYTGGESDWGYRRMVLHYAHLCAATAGTLATPARMKRFYIGSEMVGVTRIRSTAASAATASTVYPGVNALVALLVEVRALFDSYGLTGVELSYAGDWSEYHSHRPTDGSNDVYFNMDAIWGHANCDHVGIDNYLPISDWRDGITHADYGSGDDSYGNPRATNIYDLDYLRGQIEGGEMFDWYYASDADRTSQIRSTITDGAHSEHWIYRQKDMRSWWTNTHRSRPGGTRDGSVVALDNGSGGSAATWAASGKRLVFSEYGCPNVDKGSNQPNVFYDPASSESAAPYFSGSIRDDQIARAYISASITHWRDNAPTVGPVTMIIPAEMAVWTWDARPYPAFPGRADIWADGPNYDLGHWLSGRIGSGNLAEVVREICESAGVLPADIDVTGLVGPHTIMRGYLVDSIASARDMLGPLSLGYFFDGVESGGKIKFALRGASAEVAANEADLVDVGFSLVQAQASELPKTAAVSYTDEFADFQTATAEAVYIGGGGVGTAEARLPIVLSGGYARMVAEVMLQAAHMGSDSLECTLPPSLVRVDPGDTLAITLNQRPFKARIGAAELTGGIEISGETADASIYDALAFEDAPVRTGGIKAFGRSAIKILEIPLFSVDEAAQYAPRVAAYQSPFPAKVSVLVQPGLTTVADIVTPRVFGVTTAALAPGSLWRVDHTKTLALKITNSATSLLSVSRETLLGGANFMAIKSPAGEWEVMQFQTATLTGADNGLPIYDLTALLRGQLGTEMVTCPIGSEVVIFGNTPLDHLAINDAYKLLPLEYRYGPSSYGNTAETWQTITHTGRATAMLPYAPVQLHKALTDASTEVTFSWVRQTRFGGDDFETETVPLNEDAEVYDLEIYDPSGPTMLRSYVDLTIASLTYTAALQTVDGGALDAYTIKVYQKSGHMGRGRKAEATL